MPAQPAGMPAGMPEACLQAAGMPASRRHACTPQAGGAPAASLGGGLSKALSESSKRLSKRLRFGSICLEKGSSSFSTCLLHEGTGKVVAAVPSAAQVAVYSGGNGEQPSSIFSSQHGCPEGPLQCWRGDGSSFSVSIEGAPHYRPSGKIILTRLDGPPSSLPPTHRPRDGPGGISAAAAAPTLRLRLASLSTHDQHCGCASLHFQRMPNTAAAPPFTFAT